jgi:hypothetical protein
MIKKILYTVLVVLMSFSIAKVASARNANPSLCNLTWNALQYDGFSEHAHYTVDSIQRLLKKAGVMVSLAEWDTSQLYELTYSCKMEHGVTYPTLIATPINNPAAVPGVITWDATPPAV